MSTEKIHEILNGLGFQPMNQGDEPGHEPRFFKTYDAIGVVVIFDLPSGELVAFDLGDEDQVYAFRSGDLVIKDFNDSLPTLYLTKTVKLQGSNLCRLINVYRIVTLKQLEDAIEVFEKSIEVRLLNELLPYAIGERVIYNDGEFSLYGQIEDIEVTESSTKYIIKLWNGRRVATVSEDNLSKSLQSRRRFDYFNGLQTVQI